MTPVLIASREILAAVVTALVDGVGRSFVEASDFIELLQDGAFASGGGLVRADHRATFVGLTAQEIVRAARAVAATTVRPKKVAFSRCDGAERTRPDTRSVRGKVVSHTRLFTRF